VIELLLNNGIFPALAAGALLLAGGRRYADFGIGAAAAFLVVWLADNAWSWPGWPPADSKAAMPFGVLFAGLITLLPAPDLARLWVRRGLGVGVAFVAAYYVMSTQKSASAAATGALWITCWWFLADSLARLRPGGAVPLAWLVGFALAAAAFERAANLSAAQYMGGFAAACGAFFVLAGVRKLSIAGATLPFAIGLYMLLANSHHFAELPLSAAILLGVAPLGAWIGELKWFRDKPPWMDWGARVLVVAVIAGIGLGIAAANAPEPEEPNPYSMPYPD
jgi:hypothetical protein